MKHKYFFLLFLYSMFCAIAYHYHVIDMKRLYPIKWNLELGGDLADVYLRSGWSAAVASKRGRVIFPLGDQGIIKLALQQEDSLLLTVKTRLGSIHASGVRIFLNGKQLSAVYKRKSGYQESTYFTVPSEYTREGDNELKFIFTEGLQDSVGLAAITMRNYVGYSRKFPRLALLPDDSRWIQRTTVFSWATVITFLFLSVCTCLLYWVGSLVGAGGRQRGVSPGWQPGLAALAPGAVFLTAMPLTSVLSAYSFVFDTTSFLFFSFCLGVILSASVRMWTVVAAPWLRTSPLAAAWRMWIRAGKERVLASSRVYAFGFMILFSSCGLLMLVNAEKIAEQVANVAYSLLVIGVGIEVYRLIRQGEGPSGKDAQ